MDNPIFELLRVLHDVVKADEISIQKCEDGKYKFFAKRKTGLSIEIEECREESEILTIAKDIENSFIGVRNKANNKISVSGDTNNSTKFEVFPIKLK